MDPSSSDIEDLPTSTSPPLPTSLSMAAVRIMLGISAGAVIVAILFTFWTLWSDAGGPAIGAFIFQILALIALVIAGYYVFIGKIKSFAPAQTL